MWRTFADLKARARVFSNVDRVEVLTSEPFGVGVRWREHRDLRDQRLVEELRVVSADPPYSCVVESHGDGADYRVRYEFTPHKRGARLRVHFEAAARGRTG
ncbi:MAG: SRPBCC family protein, partial [Micromonosporaceae bacterium]